jgi:hypothetical protein
MEKSLSSGLSTGWNIFFRPWLVTVELLVLSFVSTRKVVRWFEFRSRKDDISASRNIAGSYFSVGSSSHASSSSSSSSFSDSEAFFFENILSLRL